MFLQSPELLKKSASVANNNATESGGATGGQFNGYEVDIVSRFCLPLCSRDQHTREVALERIEKTVQGWLDGYGSPKRNDRHGNANDATDGTNGHLTEGEYLALVRLHLPAMLRLSQNCPFADVRDKCGQILHRVKVS